MHWESGSGWWNLGTGHGGERSGGRKKATYLGPVGSRCSSRTTSPHHQPHQLVCQPLALFHLLNPRPPSPPACPGAHAQAMSVILCTAGYDHTIR